VEIVSQGVYLRLIYTQDKMEGYRRVLQFRHVSEGVNMSSSAKESPEIKEDVYEGL
jgi:hypothetical protein